MIKRALNSDQFAWRDLKILVSGYPAVTIQSFTLTRATNRIPVRTHSRYVAFHKIGNVTYTGTLTMLHSTFRDYVLPGLDLTDAPFIITATFVKEYERGNYRLGMKPFVSYNITGCHLQNWTMEYNQGDPNGLITLPFVAKKCIAL